MEFDPGSLLLWAIVGTVVAILLATVARLRRTVGEREAWLESQNRLLRRVAAGEPLEELLGHLVVALEAQAPGMLCSILLLDEGNRLHTSVAPSLPAEYNRSLDGLEIGPAVGSCGTAAYRGERVVVADIAADPLWASFREIAAAHGLGACWSEPLRSAAGTVLGTLAMYYRQPRAPSEAELRLIATAAHLAAIAVEAARARERLLHHALHDALTHLPNRTLFLDRLEMARRRSEGRRRRLFAVLFVDLDRFKLVNDSFGHLFGDELLQAIAGRLRRALRPTDTVARLGGDEFALLLEDLDDETQAVAVARRIQRDFEPPFAVGEHQVVSSASIGIAYSTGADHRPDEILRNADAAMYRAKLQGRARHAVFDPATSPVGLPSPPPPVPPVPAAPRN